MVRDLFNSNPPLKDVLLQTISKLQFQRVKLKQITVRLHKRDRILFKACVTAVRKKTRERAVTYANELVEVRKVLNTIMQIQLAMECSIVRLETIVELKGLVVDLGPTIRTLESVATYVAKVMPKMARELENMNNIISETLAMTTISSPQPIAPVEVGAMTNEKILNEASTLLEERLTEKLPKPPAHVITTEKIEPSGKVRQMVALTASCSGAHKDVGLQSTPLTIKQHTSLENALLDYAKKSKGEIDVAQCANKLNVPFSSVIETLEKLDQDGKIKIQR